MNSRTIIRRDNVYGCTDCADVRTRCPGSGKDPNNPNKKSLQYHVETIHGVADWQSMKLHLGFDIRYNDGTSGFLHPGDKPDAPLNRGGHGVVSKKAKNAVPLKRLQPTKAPKKNMTPLAIRQAALQTKAVYQDSAELNKEDPAAELERNEEISRLSRSTAVDEWNERSDRLARERNATQAEDEEDGESDDNITPMFGFSGRSSSKSSSINTTPLSRSAATHLVTSSDVVLSTFDREALDGVHGEELRRMADRALNSPGSADDEEPVSMTEQVTDLMSYLVARGNFALGERGEGLFLPLNTNN